MADMDRSSNFKYRYVSDRTTSFNDTLHTGALHNLNGEIGFDIIFPEHYSIFVIYERNHAFGSGYTDNIYIALGYLPNKDTEYAFSVNGSENLMSQFKIKTCSILFSSIIFFIPPPVSNRQSVSSEILIFGLFRFFKYEII